MEHKLVTHCARCRDIETARKKIRDRRFSKRMRFDIELKKAKASGKVIVLWQEDEFTGMHYRRKENGQTVMGGRGRYNIE